MPAGITISTTTEIPDERCGWMHGWLCVLGNGSVVCAVIGYYTYLAVPLLLFPALDRQRAFGLDDLTAMITGPLLCWPIAFVFAVLPLSLSYAWLRAAAPRLRFTVPIRLALGVALGLATNLLLLIVLRIAAPGLVSSGVAAFFPIPEIQTSALAVALVARRRWFGIA